MGEYRGSAVSYLFDYRNRDQICHDLKSEIQRYEHCYLRQGDTVCVLESDKKKGDIVIYYCLHYISDEAGDYGRFI